ncbi:hypothetical protein BSPCLSOX_319 [uncultured Gammaproteobacteria bacterium]|nr:hypothetical protein BSPCLSOX_319 [uncultured Gammaproteobacteria bacterium]
MNQGFLLSSCDLHLGDSRLQSTRRSTSKFPSCDLHLGDSRLQLQQLQ